MAADGGIPAFKSKLQGAGRKQTASLQQACLCSSRLSSSSWGLAVMQVGVSSFVASMHRLLKAARSRAPT